MAQQGQIVFSKCGRDKKRAFIVLSVEGEYAYLVDGDLRRLVKPKKKKLRHIQVTNNITKEELENDSDVRKILKVYNEKNKEVSNLV